MKKKKLYKLLEKANQINDSQHQDLVTLVTKPDSLEALSIKHRIQFVLDLSSAAFMGGYTNEEPQVHFSGFFPSLEEPVVIKNMISFKM